MLALWNSRAMEGQGKRTVVEYSRGKERKKAKKREREATKIDRDGE